MRNCNKTESLHDKIKKKKLLKQLETGAKKKKVIHTTITYKIYHKTKSNI